MGRVASLLLRALERHGVRHPTSTMFGVYCRWKMPAAAIGGIAPLDQKQHNGKDLTRYREDTEKGAFFGAA